MAMDILHFDGHPRGFLRDESNSRCVIRVSKFREKFRSLHSPVTEINLPIAKEMNLKGRGAFIFDVPLTRN